MGRYLEEDMGGNNEAVLKLDIKGTCWRQSSEVPKREE